MSSVNISSSKQTHFKAKFSSTESILQIIKAGVSTKLPSVCLLPIKVDHAQFTLLKPMPHQSYSQGLQPTLPTLLEITEEEYWQIMTQNHCSCSSRCAVLLTCSFFPSVKYFFYDSSSSLTGSVNILFPIALKCKQPDFAALSHINSTLSHKKIHWI